MGNDILHGMKTTSMADIAGIVRRERKRQGATQVELSQVANVGIRFLRDVEDGKPSVHFDKLMRILSVLGITVDILTNERRRHDRTAQSLSERNTGGIPYMVF